MSKIDKPAPVFPAPERVPAELRALCQWVCWKAVLDEEKGKFRKPPHSPLDGTAIGATQKWRQHFVAFDEAAAAAERLGLDGVGFVFTADDPYIGIDFDRCVADGQIHSIVASWLKWFGSFSEVSVSGTGVHVICRGKIGKALTAKPLPDAGDATLEIYSSGRFFAFTGDRIGDCVAINDCQAGVDKLLAHVGATCAPGPAPIHPMSKLTARKVHADNLAALLNAGHGEGNAILNSCSFFAGRAFAAGALEGTGDSIKAELLAIVTERWSTPHPRHGAQSTIESGWSSGTAQPLAILDPKREIERVDAWLNGSDAATPSLENAIASLALCDDLEIDRRRKALAELFGVSVPALKKEIAKKKKEGAQAPREKFEPATETEDGIRETLWNLLMSTGRERAAVGLPAADEAAAQMAENALWDYIKGKAQIFCTDSGQGYLLLHDKKDRPIPVRKGGQELDDFLMGLGINAGAGPRDRIGKHLGAMCFHEGARVEPRISFHYDAENFTAYFAEGMGQLIRVSAKKIERFPNGADGQLFLFPRDYEPWQMDLADLPPPTDFCPDADALLPNLLFDVLEFENESLSREDLHVLLNAYMSTLFLPGIVKGKLLLQVLGETGSAKTFFLRLLGRIIYGKKFEVTGMNDDPQQVENAIVNNSFVVFDDVKRTSNAAILGMIRRACTGGTCIRRELYSTFKQVIEPYRAAIAITCSDEPFAASDEMSNRSLVILAKQREDYIEETKFLAKIDGARNRLMAEMMVRLQNVILAVRAQRNFQPSVKNRMASFATFLLRVGRQWDWGASAQEVLDTWREEQEGAGLDQSIMEALNRWMASPGWESKRYSANGLYQELSKFADPSAWWLEKASWLSRSMRGAFHAYHRHYGFCFSGRTSGHRPSEYWFEPSNKAPAARAPGLPFPEEKAPF